MRLFKRTNSTFQPVAGQRFADEHYESHLEEWLYHNPQLISDDLLMIGRQVITDDGKRIDLLALDKEGNTVIIELKRGETTRDLVGQINEYISSVEQWDERELERRTKHQPRTLDKQFCQRFNCAAPTEFNAQQKAVVIVESIDEMTRSTFKRQGIRVLTFSYLKSAEEEYILVNDLDEGTAAPAPRAAKVRRAVVTNGADTDEDEWRATPEETETFFRFLNTKVLPLLQQSCFKREDGWRTHRDTRWVRLHFSHKDWDTTWEGFTIGFDNETEGTNCVPKTYIMVNTKPRKHSDPLLAELRPREQELRAKLGDAFQFCEPGDEYEPMYEYITPHDDARKVAERMTAFKDILMPYLDRVLARPTKT